jgi:hypothetical protein
MPISRLAGASACSLIEHRNARLTVFSVLNDPLPGDEPIDICQVVDGEKGISHFMIAHITPFYEQISRRVGVLFDRAQERPLDGFQRFEQRGQRIHHLRRRLGDFRQRSRRWKTNRLS